MRFKNGAVLREELHYHPGNMDIKPKAFDPHLVHYQQEGIVLMDYPACFPPEYTGYEGAKTSDRVYYNEAMDFAKARHLPEVLLMQEDGLVEKATGRICLRSWMECLSHFMPLKMLACSGL